MNNRVDIQLIGIYGKHLLPDERRVWKVNEKMVQAVIFWDEWITGTVLIGDQNSLYFVLKREWHFQFL